MTRIEIEKIREQIVQAEKSGDEERVIHLSRQLSDSGSWYGSYKLGYTHEDRAMRVSKHTGVLDRQGFITAAHWYTRALSQEENYWPHDRLAAYYYFGLNGERDFKLAYEHLRYCIEHAEFVAQEQSAEANHNLAVNKMMLAELLSLGLGAPKDINFAKELFSSVARLGYPAAMLGLSDIAKAEKRHWLRFYYLFRAAYRLVRLRKEDRNNHLLEGTGSPHSIIRIVPSTVQPVQF